MRAVLWVAALTLPALADAQDMAAVFAESTDHVDYILAGPIDPGASYTVEMWAQFTLANADTLICAADAAYVSAFCLQYRDTYWLAEIDDDDVIEADSCDVTELHPHICLPDDLPEQPMRPLKRHIAITVTPEELALWLDGEQVAAVPTGVATDWTGTEWALGVDAEPEIAPFPAGWNNDPMDGLLDEVRIWDHARTAEEMACTRDWGLTGLETGLVALWSMDEVLDGTTPDATGHGHDGTLFGDVALTPSPFGLTGSVGGDVPCVDFDLDGFTPDDGDCDDADPEIHPDAEDVANDGIDQDCVDGDRVTTTRLRGGMAGCDCDTGSGPSWGVLVALLALAQAVRGARTRVGQRSPSS